MKSIIYSFVILFTLGVANAQPLQRLDPLLAEKLAHLDETTPVAIIIVLADQVDVNTMGDAFKAARASKEVRHVQVVTALQQKAAATQGPILQHLAARQSAGSIIKYEPMWIVNMVFASATKQAVYELAERTDVEMIFEDGLLQLDEPVDSSPASPSSPGSAEPNLRAINANRLWDLGYTGQGTLVMNIDTGVNGVHPALASRWRGNQPGVLWYHAWHDQRVPASSVPLDYGSTKHGSHTMGIMMGLDPVTADTIGVAPSALWIASPTIDVGFSPHTSYTLKAFQWAADPDSNLATSDDVPDVISNSYQDPNVSATECSGAAGYWAAVDALEAMGTAVIWSAGNAGSGASTITPPKNRITTNVNFFAVGNLNTTTAQPWVISSTSSRGPSKCDNTVVKPEVVAPGTTIRSALAGTSYGNLSGTSMASPHVAGALALLRSANPAFTCSELKEVLYNTAIDYGVVGEDNTYGNGFIDLWAAFQQISVANPRIEGTVVNASGDTLSDVSVENITTGITVKTNQRGFFRFVLQDTGVYRIRFTKLGFFTTIDTVQVPHDSTTYTRNITLASTPPPAVGVNPPSIILNISHGDSATRTLTVSNTGISTSQLAYSLSITGGIGGLLEDPVGTSASTFSGSNLVRGNRYQATRRTTLKEIKSYHVIGTSTQMRFAVYESSTPTGSYTRIFDGPPVTSGTGTGFFGSGPISVQLDSGKYYLIGAGWQGSITYYNSTSSATPVGFGTALSGFTASYPPPASITISSTTTAFYRGAVVTTSGQFITVTNAQGDTLGGGLSSDHTVKVVTQYLDPAGGPYSGHIVVTSNDTAQATVLIPVSVDFTTGVPERTGIPATYALRQNYPNPFNPSTTINFDLPEASHVSLVVFDVLGRRVAEVANGQFDAGYRSVVWQAGNLASGVYFVRFNVSDAKGLNRYSTIAKLMLMK
ncbi:MAG: S8 family serine peptidase [Bacteroidetes bacterium]|nr:S8 family serine peptidase [Bacteroidota bacterium]MCW5894244.1 S8 family serine peptidase [Bacteroidota bacterium]